MKKHYITNEIVTYNLKIKEGDSIEFEMPSFCSGDYTAKIYKDSFGFYINADNNYFEGCRDFTIIKSKK